MLYSSVARMQRAGVNPMPKVSLGSIHLEVTKLEDQTKKVGKTSRVSFRVENRFQFPLLLTPVVVCMCLCAKWRRRRRCLQRDRATPTKRPIDQAEECECIRRNKQQASTGEQMPHHHHHRLEPALSGSTSSMAKAMTSPPPALSSSPANQSTQDAAACFPFLPRQFARFKVRV